MKGWVEEWASTVTTVLNIDVVHSDEVKHVIFLQEANSVCWARKERRRGTDISNYNLWQK